MKKLFLLLVAVLTIGLCASAQTRTVKGTVIDATTEEPLIGASVTAAGNSMGQSTDLDGDFTIVVPAATTHLTVSYVGYKPAHVKITDGKIIVRMHQDANVLDDVIVTAYGTSKRSEYTGSASVVKADQLEDALVTTVTNALSGRVAGVQILSSNGQPGAAPTVLVRGVGSINASTKPLYVVDGVPYEGDIAGLAPSDIESMTVLKDAASTALYGARGANGVIMVTTKKGSEGAARITLDTRWGSNSRALPNYDVVKDGGQYIEGLYSALYMTNYMAGVNPGVENPYEGWASNAAARQYALGNIWSQLGYQTYDAHGQAIVGLDGRFNPSATAGWLNQKTGYWYQPDDWAKESLTNGLRQEYNLSVSGGTDKFNYYLSGSFLGDEGIISNSNYNRMSTRSSVDYKAKSWLRLGTNINYTYVTTNSPENQTEGASSGNAFYIANAIAPVYPIFARRLDGNGVPQIEYNTAYGHPIYDYGDGQTGAVRTFMSMANPASDLLYNTEEYLMDILDAKGYAVITPLEGLTINASLGYFVDNTRYHKVNNPLYGQSANYNGEAIQEASRTRVINEQVFGEYQRTFNDVHNASLMAGYESYEMYNESVSAQGQNLYNPMNWTVSNTIDQRYGSGSAGSYATRGFFGRAKYNYAERYFLQASYRRDASSRFHPDKRWGNFWSASFAWEIAKEKFMEDFTNVDMLKFKASFGQNGNDNIGNYYAYLDQYRLTGSNGVFNDAQLLYKGNPDITWETSNNINTGFDFSFFKGMISGTVEYYQRQVSDMLFNVPVAPSLGYSSIPRNVGSMRNNGVELEVNYRPINTSEVTWDVYANLTLPNSVVTKLTPELLNGNGDWINGSLIFHEGESRYQMYLVKYAGVNADNGLAEYWARKPLLDEKGAQVVENGMEQWESEEYRTSNWADAYKSNRTKTGNLMPKGYGGFGTTLNAFGFDASVTFAYQFGGRMYDNSYSSYMHGFNQSSIGTNFHKDLLNAWTPENRNTDVPRLSTTDQYTRSLSDRFLTSSNYLSLNNVTVGYTLPENLTSKYYLHNVRFYASAENIALWSKRQGFDPRQGFTASSNETYSPIRCISGGVRLSF